MNRFFMSLICGFALLASTVTYAGKDLKFTAAIPVAQDSIMVKVVRRVYSRAGISISVVPMPAKRSAYENASNISDGELLRVESFGIGKEYLTKLSLPLGYIEIQVFSAMDEEEIDVSDLCSNKIAIINGAKFAGDLVKECGQVEKLNSAKQLMMYLDRGRADIGILDKTIGLNSIRQLHHSLVATVGEPVAKVPLYHFLNKKHEALVPEIEKILSEMTQSGELKAIWDERYK